MGLNDRPLLRLQPVLLQQDRVRDPDLPDVVEGGSPRDQLVRGALQPHDLGDAPGDPTHAQGVLAGLVVPELRRAGEAIEDLEAGLFQLMGALRDPLLQRRVVVPHLLVEEPGLEKVTDTEADFRGTEWLREEVPRPSRQGPPPRFGSVVARGDQDRQVRPGRLQRTDRRNEVEAVEPAHPEVRDHHVRIQLDEPIQRLAGVGEGDQGAVALGLENVSQELQIRGLVVHHEDAGTRQPPVQRVQIARYHRYLQARGSSGDAESACTDDAATPRPSQGTVRE
jgi:hypothetical protein